jgi:uridylate kinase
VVVEIHADVILKGTRVDGVYDSDPEKTPAVKFDSISFEDVLQMKCDDNELSEINCYFILYPKI